MGKLPLIIEMAKENTYYKRYAAKYSEATAINEFMKTDAWRKLISKHNEKASIDDLADLYMFIMNMDASQFLSVLIQLERTNQFEVPAMHGILTIDYWDQYSLNHLTRRLDMQRLVH